MRSSLNRNYGSRGPSAPKSWSPSDLGSAPEKSASEQARRVEYILGLFKPPDAFLDGLSRNAAAKKTGSRTNMPSSSPAMTAGYLTPVQEWAPGEISPFHPVIEVVILPHFEGHDQAVERVAPPEEEVSQEELAADKKEIFGLRAEADRLIANAKEEAERITHEAKEKAEEILMKAHQDGWAAAEAETAPIIETAKSIVEQVSSWREEMFAQSESAVLELVRDIAQQLFGQGYVLDSEPLQNAFNHVLESAQSLGNLKIYVNPDDAAGLGPYWREFQVSISGRQVQIIPTESISRGGCFVDGDFGSVDARIETQLKTILESISEGILVGEQVE